MYQKNRKNTSLKFFWTHLNFLLNIRKYVLHYMKNVFGIWNSLGSLQFLKNDYLINQ
jgi:hypothetical protein